MKAIALLIIKIYRLVFSPFLVTVFGRACKYDRTCSQYAEFAIRKFGVVQGGALAIKRFLSCNSFVKSY